MLKKAVIAALSAISPGALNSLYLYRHTRKEAEISLLPALLPKGGIAIDVGANKGLYINHLLNITPNIIAFEPLPPMQNWVRRHYGSRIRLETVALSDHAGETVIRFPKGNYAWATIAETNNLELRDHADAVESASVKIATLDSYNFPVVDFIKIDVEGHELSVVKGALQTIKRCRPNLLIEIEERHSKMATSAIPDLLAAEGYAGLYIYEGKLYGMSEFVAERDQPISNVGTAGKVGRYINNFIFIPKEHVEQVKQYIRKINA